MQGLGNSLFPQPRQEVGHLVVEPLIRLLSRGVPHGVICSHGMAHVGYFSELPRVMIAQLYQMLARWASLKPPVEI